MSHGIEQLVDQLLLERGSYEPLLLLQHMGSLKYRHYDAWRSGKAVNNSSASSKKSVSILCFWVM